MPKSKRKPGARAATTRKGRQQRLVRSQRELDAKLEKAFNRGYICAVANLMREHDQDVMAQDLLRSMRGIKWRHIDAYDKKALRGVRRNMDNG